MGFFSPLLHETTSLSIIQEYLALQGGPYLFTRDSTCTMLFRLEHKLVMFLVTALSPSGVPTLTLGSQPKQRFAKVQAENETRKSHFMFSGM